MTASSLESDRLLEKAEEFSIIAGRLHDNLAVMEDGRVALTQCLRLRAGAQLRMKRQLFQR